MQKFFSTILILISFNLVSGFTFADSAGSSSSSNSSSSTSSSLSSEKQADSSDSVAAAIAAKDVMGQKAKQTHRFDDRTVQHDYNEAYDRYLVQFKKGQVAGQRDGYRHVQRNTSQKPAVYQAGYQYGFDVGQDRWVIEHNDDSSSQSSSESFSKPNQAPATQSEGGKFSTANSITESHDESTQPVQDESPVVKNFVSTTVDLPLGPVVASHQKFINLIGAQAQSIAEQNDLYASVMIAQAALESSWGTSDLSRPPYFNLFGVKGGYLGGSVTMTTGEDDGQGNWSNTQASFRRYTSYAESLHDYADVLSDPLYLTVRKSHCADYKQATQGLIGRYATDSSYNLKLNQIIATYHLEQFDGHTPESGALVKVHNAKSKHQSRSQPAHSRQANHHQLALWWVLFPIGMTIGILIVLNWNEKRHLDRGQDVE